MGHVACAGDFGGGHGVFPPFPGDGVGVLGGLRIGGRKPGGFTIGGSTTGGTVTGGLTMGGIVTGGLTTGTVGVFGVLPGLCFLGGLPQ